MTGTKMSKRGVRWIGTVSWAYVGLGFGLGCDAQVDPSYRGEPLATIQGRVDASSEVSEAEVGILWLTASADFDLVCTGVSTPSREESACVAACGEINCNTLEAWGDCVANCPEVTEVLVNTRTPTVPFVTGAVGETTPAIGEFPALFTLDILEPPPEDVLIGSATGEALAIGMFVALDPKGAPWRLDVTNSPGLPDWLLGGSDSHLLVYAPESVPASSSWSYLFGLPFTPGYHLLESALVTMVDENGEEVEPPPPREVLPEEISQVVLRIAPPESLTWVRDLLGAP